MQADLVRVDDESVPRRVLLVLTYYRPHVSGLTIYVERLARELAGRRHQVTVLTSRYDRTLPAGNRWMACGSCVCRCCSASARAW